MYVLYVIDFFWFFVGTNTKKYVSVRVIAPFYRSVIAPLCYCTVLLLHRCVIAPFCYCTVLLLHRSVIAPFCYCTVLLLHRSVIAPFLTPKPLQFSAVHSTDWPNVTSQLHVPIHMNFLHMIICSLHKFTELTVLLIFKRNEKTGHSFSVCNVA